MTTLIRLAMSSRPMRRRGPCCFVVPMVAAGVSVVAQPPASEAPKVPDRARWVKLDCMTSGCHAKLAAKKVVHGAVSQGGCDACHDVADGAKHTFSLVAEEGEMCLDCHEELSDALEDTDTMLSRHFPVAEGECLSCHDPHASKWPALLVESYRERRYGHFDESQFELCFQCHDPELVTEKETDEATAFRNGTVSLHHVHVGADAKGRNCRTCHLPHVSTQARLVREGIMFKKWKLPLKYLPTKNGGYCASACHVARAYDRIQPVAVGTTPAIPPK